MIIPLVKSNHQIAPVKTVGNGSAYRGNQKRNIGECIQGGVDVRPSRNVQYIEGQGKPQQGRSQYGDNLPDYHEAEIPVSRYGTICHHSALRDSDSCKIHPLPAAKICFMGSKVPFSAPRTASMASMNPFIFCSISQGVHVNIEESNNICPETNSICMVPVDALWRTGAPSLPGKRSRPGWGRGPESSAQCFFRASGHWPADGTPQSSCPWGHLSGAVRQL